MDERLTPEQFKAIITLKGWTQAEVAALFGKSRGWLNTVGRDPSRPAHYDFAIIGLPNKRTYARDMRQLRRRVDMFLGNQPQAAVEEKKNSGEYRYHGYLVVGAVLTASDDVGSIAEAGTRGIVFSVIDSGEGERYGVIFETGLWDWFSPIHVDACLATTGLNDPELESYQFKGDDILEADFNAGRFNFWPG